MQAKLSLFLSRVAQVALMWPRSAKRSAALACDTLSCIVAVWLAFYLRLGEWPPFSTIIIVSSLVSILLSLPIFVANGLYRAIFRYNGLSAVLALIRANLVYLILYSGIFTFWGVEGVPRTVGLLQPILLFLLVGASRALARTLLGGIYHQQLRRSNLPRALIYGAGNAGRQLASAILNSPEIRVVGYLDDDDRLHGHVLNGLPIYNPKNLTEILGEEEVTDILLALPSISRQRRNEIINVLKDHKLAVRTLPGLSDIAIGKIAFSDIRELDIDDLLGRESVKPDNFLLNLNIRGKTVLVTGAGGSIGSELCRQVLKRNPKLLLLLESSELALYQIHQELSSLADKASSSAQTAGIETDSNLDDAVVNSSVVEIVPLLASVCDQNRIQAIMDAWRPDTVYHAAAYKHVPLVEHNPIEGIRNNVWGTRVCAECALRSGVRNFVLVSTDKAVRPTNVMGATKRLAEMVLQALAETVSRRTGSSCGIPTIFSMVRFGNVLGSSGSVVPLFREQIRNGGPITLTDPEIMRYFMTIPEAAQLVVQAGAMGEGGDVFVLDMGEPIKILDLAHRMVELSGLCIRDEGNPQGDIEIVITGLRPGEKLYEELLIGDNPQPTRHKQIMKANEQFLSWDELVDPLNALNGALMKNDVVKARDLLIRLVNGYTPQSDIVDWIFVAEK